MQTIYLDISNKGVVPTIYAKQGDIGRKVQVIFTDSWIPYKIPENAKLSVWYDGDSGDGNYTDVGDKSAIVVENNKVTFELITQMLNNDGEGIVCLIMNVGEEQIGSWNIHYLCENVPGFDSEGASSYFTAFSESVNKLKDTDKTLTKEGYPADAKATGDKIDNLSAADVGAAPGGWGFGGAMDYIVDENGTFETKLDEILAGMESHSVKQFSFFDSKGLHSTKFYGRLWKYTQNYATLEAVNYNGNKALKCKLSGHWDPWEWENPPMTPGIEYRTTERFDGSPVYCGLVSYTNAENIGDTSSMVDVEIPHPFSGLGKPVRATGRQGGVYPIPNITSSGANYTIARVDKSSIKLRLNKCTFDSRTWYFTIYYTK